MVGLLIPGALAAGLIRYLLTDIFNLNKTISILIGFIVMFIVFGITAYIIKDVDHQEFP